MCETLTGSPVNTGEQPPPETAPSVAQTNGESQPPPEVPQVSSPTEDPVQPQPEQVAPPTVTATDGCPELPSSGDNAHPPAAETGDTTCTSPDTRNISASRAEMKPRKRKRVNGKMERNVKKKQSKTTCPESPCEASSPDASLNDEVTTGSKVTKGRSRGVTRYTVAKKQLDDALEETVRLKNVISLLESEIDLKNKELSKLRKNDISQKSEIKKLSILVDYQKHELRKDTTTSRDVPDRENSCLSLNDCDNDSSVDDLVVVNRRRKSAKVQVVSTRKPISSPLSKSVVDTNAPRSQPDTLREPSSTALPCGQVAVIGSSIVRGVGLGLNKRGVDAVTFTYPGCEVPQITERISDILTKAYQPDTVVLQCGGNDLQNNRTPSEVIHQIDILVNEVKRCCPGATVVVNKIPSRGHDDVLLNNISFVNDLISNLAGDILCLDPCPKMFRYYANDEVHLNRSGKRFFVHQLAKSLINFHWPQLQSTR